MTAPPKKRGGDHGGRRPKIGPIYPVKLPDAQKKHCIDNGGAELVRALLTLHETNSEVREMANLIMQKS